MIQTGGGGTSNDHHPRESARWDASTFFPDAMEYTSDEALFSRVEVAARQEREDERSLPRMMMLSSDPRMQVSALELSLCIESRAVHLLVQHVRLTLAEVSLFSTAKTASLR